MWLRDDSSKQPQEHDEQLREPLNVGNDGHSGTSRGGKAAASKQRAGKSVQQSKHGRKRTEGGEGNPNGQKA